MKISIIIPVYNSEKYLYECLDSVLNQNFTDFEVLLINDGSTDNSGQICDDYAAKDARFKVFHKENGGVSTARNLGLDHAKGEWIAFMDSDDQLKEKYIEELLNSTLYDSVDLVVQGYTAISVDKKRKVSFGNDIVLSNDYIKLFEEKEIFKYGYPFSKLFKNQIIRENKLRFPERYSFAEDLSFFLAYLSYCKQIKFDEKYNYYYVSHPNSLSKSVKKPEEYWERFIDFKRILKEFYPDVFQEVFFSGRRYIIFNKSVGGALFYYVQSLYLNKNVSKEDRLKYLAKINKEDSQLIKHFIKHLNHPIYKMGFYLLLFKKLKLADFLFQKFM